MNNIEIKYLLERIEQVIRQMIEKYNEIKDFFSKSSENLLEKFLYSIRDNLDDLKKEIKNVK